ncbi:hypothetical protein [Aneurinibacillus danicus]|jgi:hypothetical protein|uniref:Uncharacterized protein n=1 Tax=Aneurinibacillus danicus TaxID=267746 RepID=A0A511VEX3_9BACL|nr:hypothetical protein [Aneurinibacillus danicus]GEN35832.1 hypothetical protein ADA01nite_32920 [Aneurinibacillus danicus]
MHIDNGFCYKCDGKGTLPYNPNNQPVYKDEEWSEQERIEIEQEQEMIARAETENWMAANNIDPLDFDY